nr:unnamed protein product [Callosobruchus chinensis]
MSEVTGISRTSIQRILKHYKWHPYKIQLLHELNEDDHDRRLQFCEIMDSESRELFNDHDHWSVSPLLDGDAQSYCTALPKCLICASDHMTHVCPQTGLEEPKCANCGGGHSANIPT